MLKSCKEFVKNILKEFKRRGKKGEVSLLLRKIKAKSP